MGPRPVACCVNPGDVCAGHCDAGEGLFERTRHSRHPGTGRGSGERSAVSREASAGTGRRWGAGDDGGLRDAVYRGGRAGECECRGGCAQSAHRKEARLMIAPSHFTAVLLFALCASVVFGITMRETPARMFRYGLYCFALFVGSAIVLSWGMYLIAR